MFDSLDAAEVDSAALDLVRVGVREEAQAAARTLTGAWRFFKACLREFDADDLGCPDTYDAVAAEIGAAAGRSYRYGHQLMEYGVAMHERLPNTGAALAAGEISYVVFTTIVYRTHNITDPQRLAAVDERIAATAARWKTYSRTRLATAVDAIVAAHDPDAVRRRAETELDECTVWVGPNTGGFAEISGTVLATTGAALDARLDALADTVCARDPRTQARRRAAAVDALVAGLDRMACDCRTPDCAAYLQKPAGPTTVYVVGGYHDEEVDEPCAQAPVADAPTAEAPVAEPATSTACEGEAPVEPTTPARPRPKPGYLLGSDELIPPAVMDEIRKTAREVPIPHPGPASTPLPSYRPSKAMADFVRARDLTCRAPGCDRPATVCELDHTVPHSQGGTTHPSNLKCLCVFHHALKTFWGWRDEQLPDGTVIWRTRAGYTYVTHPGSMILFPQLCAATGWLDPPPATRVRCRPTIKRRTHTRTQSRAARIAHERAANRHERHARQAAIQAEHDANPPPF